MIFKKVIAVGPGYSSPGKANSPVDSPDKVDTSATSDGSTADAAEQAKNKQNQDKKQKDAKDLSANLINSFAQRDNLKIAYENAQKAYKTVNESSGASEKFLETITAAKTNPCEWVNVATGFSIVFSNGDVKKYADNYMAMAKSYKLILGDCIKYTEQLYADLYNSIIDSLSSISLPSFLSESSENQNLSENSENQNNNKNKSKNDQQKSQNDQQQSQNDQQQSKNDQQQSQNDQQKSQIDKQQQQDYQQQFIQTKKEILENEIYSIEVEMLQHTRLIQRQSVSMGFVQQFKNEMAALCPLYNLYKNLEGNPQAQPFLIPMTVQWANSLDTEADHLDTFAQTLNTLITDDPKISDLMAAIHNSAELFRAESKRVRLNIFNNRKDGGV